MSKTLFRIWQFATTAMLTAIAIAFSIKMMFGVSVLLSIVNGESMIGFWVKQGASYPQALAVAVICGNYDALTYFILFGWLRSIQAETIVTTWRYRLYRALRWIGRKLGRYCVPEPENGYPVTPWHYLPLPAYGAWPGCIAVGINYAINFGLRQEYAFAAIALGNIAKMVVFTLASFTIKVNPLITLAVAFCLAHFTKGAIEKALRHAERWGAERATAEAKAQARAKVKVISIRPS